MKTTLPKPRTDSDRAWLVVDADGKPLGRLATKIADVLRGKNKPSFTPHMDTGDFVVVINAKKVKLSGRKEENKTYRRYTGFRGGLRETTAAEVRARHPERLVLSAVKGMLPKNAMGRQVFRRLKVYAGTEHPHTAQKPETIELI